MDPWRLAVLVLAVLVLLLAAGLRSALRRLRRLASLKQSQATRHGQTLEQFAPLLEGWPWDPKGFRFLGAPVDGVQFTDDGVVFVEIKTGRSTLNAVQRRIREQVEAGRVSWREIRL